MLTNVKILSPSLQKRCGKVSLVLESGINILLGPNGSGKSTLLNAIRSVHSGAISTSQVELTLSDPRFPMPLFYHSSDGIVRTEGENDGSNLGSLQSRHESHGQTLGRYLLSIDNQVDPAVFLVDEPEVALSADKLVEFREMIIAKSSEGMQFCLASHNPIIFTIPDATIHFFGKDKTYFDSTLAIYRKYLGMKRED